MPWHTTGWLFGLQMDRESTFAAKGGEKKKKEEEATSVLCSSISKHPGAHSRDVKKYIISPIAKACFFT